MGPESEQYCSALHTRTYAKVFRYFYYRLVPRDECEDVTQEVFLRFFAKYAHKVETLSDVDVDKLLYTIAGFVHKEWIRAALRSRTVEWDDAYDHVMPFEVFMGEEHAAAIDRDQDMLAQQARAGITQLSNERMRQVLTMRFLEGKTRSEVAQELGMSEKAVHVYQRRGIDALRQHLQTQAVTESTNVSPHA